MKNKVKLWLAIALNLAVVVLEIIGLVQSWNTFGWAMFQFYTQDSNYFAMVTSFLFVIYALKKLRDGKALPSWLTYLKYGSTCCLALTFLVVLCVLIPMGGAASIQCLLVVTPAIYHHVICPILMLVSFLLLEPDFSTSKKAYYFALAPTLMYAVVVIILNLTGALYGPYPFLHVYEQPWWMSILWVFTIIGLDFLIAFLVRLFRRLIDGHKKAKAQ